jgi:hypothetical protein
MRPHLPLSWIGTTTRKRDQGLYHLEALVNLTGRSIVVAACGTRPFAYAGSYPDNNTSTVGYRCQRCEAMAKKLRGKGGVA